MVKSRKKWQLVYQGDIENFDNAESLEYWKDKSANEKFAEVTRLIKQALAIQGKTHDGSGLLRTTAVIKFP